MGLNRQAGSVGGRRSYMLKMYARTSKDESKIYYRQQKQTAPSVKTRVVSSGQQFSAYLHSFPTGMGI